MSDPARLHEEDWFAWVEDQAAKLRDWPPHLRPNAIDIENLAEEIEGLGKEVLAQIEGYLRRIVEHLLKLEFHPDQAARRHWMKEVAVFRADLNDRLNRKDEPTLFSRRAAIYAKVWPRGLKLFRTGLEIDGLPLPEPLRDPAAPPRYDLDTQVLDPDWYPPAHGP